MNDQMKFWNICRCEMLELRLLCMLDAGNGLLFIPDDAYHAAWT
jgi:hypothetical protein